MNHYQNVSKLSSEKRTFTENVLTSVRIPSPSPLERQPIYANNPPIDKVYKSELIINPKSTTYLDKCHKCDGLINRQSNESIKFNNESYHRRCFTCSICRGDLSSTEEQSLRSNDKGEPICRKCSDDKPPSRCFACSQTIPAGRYTTYKGNQYHLDCFKCYFCRSVIREMEFPSHNNNPCCERCYEKFAVKCHQCAKPITSERAIIYAGNKYHPECFRCGQCQRAITELEFHMRDAKPCCKQCHAKHFEPQCEQCLKPITVGPTTTQNGKTYHPECFRCGQCQRAITELEFRMRDAKPCCNQCHVKHFEPQCEQCLKPITVGSTTTHNGKTYHPECFRCGQCYRAITELEFHMRDAKPCCNQCHAKHFEPQCEQCLKPITVGTTTTHNGKTYHPECFRCGQCQRAITELEFRMRDAKPCCNQCHVKHFEPQCEQCLKPITVGSTTTHNGKTYHPECFRCGQCYRAITELEFHMRDAKPCCKQCHAKHFEPQCEQCLKPITVGSTTTYNGKTYHPECFRCGQCQRVISDVRFYRENNKPCCNDCHERYFTLKCAKCDCAIVDRYSTYKGQNYHLYCFVCTKCRRILDKTEKFYEDPNGVLCIQCGN